MIRLALLTEIPAPFRVPLFNELAATDDVDLSVQFLSLRDPKRPYYPVLRDEFRFGWEVLPGRNVVERPRWVVANRGVVRALRRRRADVVVLGGWNQPAFWTAAVYARTARIPFVPWVESTVRDARSEFAGFEVAKRALLRASAGVLVPGRASAEYAAALGVPRESIRIAPNAVDDRLFRDRVDEVRRERDAVRDELGVAGVVFLYAGRLDPEKGVDLLLRAAEGLDDATVAVAGDGSQEEALRAGAPANVRFLGRLGTGGDELLRWYAAADAFVLPSRSEQWGMVLNEAAAAALPIVASDAAGAAHDLVVDGDNGYRVPAGDTGALADALRRVAADEAFRARAGARSRELVSGHTPRAWAEAVARLAREVVG